MEFDVQLPPQTVTAASDSGTTQDLKKIPTVIDGGYVYVRKLRIRVNGTVTSTAGGSWNPGALFRGFQLKVPTVGDLIQTISGSEAVRLYRAEHRGRWSPFVSPSTSAKAWQGVSGLAAGANNVDLTFVIDFARPFAVSPDETSLPAVLLHAAQPFVMQYLAAKTDLIADCTAFSLTATVTAVCFRSRKPFLPAVTILDNFGLVGTSPTTLPTPGRIATGIIVPDGLGKFPAGTDYTTLGITFGNDLMLNDNGITVRELYNNFNETAEEQLEIHLDAQTDYASFIPVVGPWVGGGLHSEHLSTDVVPMAAPLHLKADVAANNYRFTRRYQVAQQSAQGLAVARIVTSATGLKPQYAQTASGKAGDPRDLPFMAVALTR